MKIKISKDALNEAIQDVSKAISNRTTIPILNGIKFEADADGVMLTASDAEISIQSFIPAEKDGNTAVAVEQPGSVVFPAKFFAEIVRKLPTEEIDIEIKENFIAWIRSGMAEVQIVGLDPEEYPLLPQIEKNRVISIASDLLKTMIRQTSFAVAVTETSPILTGVLWSLDGDRLKLTACDRLRMASREAGIHNEHQERFHDIVIPGKSLNELAKLLPDQNSLVDIYVADNQVMFKIDTVSFYTRILDGTYPDMSKLIPQSFQTELTVNTKKLTDAIDRAYSLSREEKTNIVKLALQDDRMIEISSSLSELGKVTEQLDVHQRSGENITVSFNSRYMLDALKAIDSDFVRIGFRGATQPIFIKPEDHSNMVHIIMPYRTAG